MFVAGRLDTDNKRLNALDGAIEKAHGQRLKLKQASVVIAGQMEKDETRINKHSRVLKKSSHRSQGVEGSNGNR